MRLPGFGAPARAGVGKRPKLTFIGWNDRLPGSSSVEEMPAGDVAEDRAQSRCWRGTVTVSPSRSAAAESAGKQADRRRLDIALAAGDLPGKAPGAALP